MHATRIAISALGLIIAGACAGSGGATGGTSAGPTNDPAVRSAIDSADAKFVVAFKAGDAAGASAFYEQDATSMPPNSEAQTGHAAIEKGYADLFKALGKVEDFTAQIKDIDIYADHAIEIGTYAMSFTPAGAKEAQKDHGSYINYWRKQADGSWKIHRDAIVSANPLPAPPAAPPAKK
jgi:uncharacterized protein (TIGR02246 family)